MTETLNTTLSESQLKKVKALAENTGLNFETDNVNKLQIYNFYAKRYGITIICDWTADNDNEYKVIDATTKAPITGKTLDIKIAEILNEENKAKRTIEHVKNNNDGKIHSITSTSYVHPNAKILEAILKEAKVELPLNVRVELARRYMQEAFTEIKELTLEQNLEQIIRHESYLRALNDVVNEQYRAKNKVKAARIDEVHRSAQIKAHKSKPKIRKSSEPKMSKQDKSILSIVGNDEAKRKALMAILEDSPVEQKFSISTTKSKEESYGS